MNVINKRENIGPLLRQTHLFNVMSDEQLDIVLGPMRMLRLSEGERLFEVGQQAERFYLVVEGQIKLFRVSEGGHEKIIELIGPGKMFAEAVMFMKRHRFPVSAAALQPSEICSFSSRVFLDVLCDSTDLCFALMADMSMRLHTRINEIEQLTLQNATFRVVSYLLDLLPDPSADVQVIDLPTPKNIIASRVSVTPETFSRILHTMSKEGILSIRGKAIDVHDTARLRRFGR